MTRLRLLIAHEWRTSAATRLVTARRWQVQGGVPSCTVQQQTMRTRFVLLLTLLHAAPCTKTGLVRRSSPAAQPGARRPIRAGKDDSLGMLHGRCRCRRCCCCLITLRVAARDASLPAARRTRVARSNRSRLVVVPHAVRGAAPARAREARAHGTAQQPACQPSTH